MKKTQSQYVIFVFLVITSVLLSACGAAPTHPDCATTENFCVGLVGQEGKINDQALNQMAWEGLQRAERRLGAYIQYIATVDSRDYEKNILAFANAGYDLIITVGYSQRQATIKVAKNYPSINFIGVDQPLDPDKSLPDNLAGLSFPEDQAGFLAGALAAQMTRTNKIGAVCGPDTFPPAWRYCQGFKAGAQYITSSPEEEPTEEPPLDEEPTFEEEPTEEPFEEEPTEEPFEEEPDEEEPDEEEVFEEFARQRSASGDTTQEEEPTPEVPVEEVPPVEVTLMYHNAVAFSDSIVDPEWDAESTNTLIDAGADIIFGSASYDENGAVSAAAKRGAYAIGVNTDEFLTIPGAENVLLSSAIKQVTIGVFELIRNVKDGGFERGNFIGDVGYAPFHNLTPRVPNEVKVKMDEIQAGLNDGTLETGVPPTKLAASTADEQDPPEEEETPVPDE